MLNHIGNSFPPPTGGGIIELNAGGVEKAGKGERGKIKKKG